jgi:hypothetical protein
VRAPLGVFRNDHTLAGGLALSGRLEAVLQGRARTSPKTNSLKFKFASNGVLRTSRPFGQAERTEHHIGWAGQLFSRITLGIHREFIVNSSPLAILVNNQRGQPSTTWTLLSLAMIKGASTWLLAAPEQTQNTLEKGVGQ